MLIDDELYRWTQIGIIVAVPALLLLRAIWKRRFKRGIGLAIAAFFALTIAASVFTVSSASAVLRVTPGGRIATFVVLGSARYRFSNGAEATVTAAGRQMTLVINDSDKPMTVKAVQYSVGGWGSPGTTPAPVVPPFSLYTAEHGIAYYGRGEHAPPATVQSAAPQAWVSWLTDAAP